MKKKLLTTLALATSVGLAVSGCAGSAGSAGAAGGGEGGFDYGASQAEVDAALADLEPVTLKYQPSAASPNSVMATSAHAYKEAVEERSGGKITLELVWGQAIAGYAEIDDALADGRLDLAYNLPIYNPSEYPSFDAAVTAMSGLPTSPVVGELVSNAVSGEIGWQAESLLGEYEAQGVVPLTPIIASGTYYGVCNQEGNTLDDWNGRQVRVASTSHHTVAENLGASPVSMEYVEVFEALQRGTVDCTLAQLISSAEAGVLEVAPHISYTTDENSMSSRAVGAELAGASFETLPLAYKQIIFDAANEVRPAAGATSIVNGTALAVTQAKEAGGTITPFGPEADEAIGKTNEELIAGVVDTGLLGDDIEQRIRESSDKWVAKAEELGYRDEGTIEDLDEWWDGEAVDFSDWSTAVYQESMLAHRPE
ncbi:hypothetical protein GCM10022261_02570 [Brevibacterium daeguense]|uniref:TRAP-type C4-dicarboxylate transport system substrate-binding protein n=1 Tax=Brevibacterium daeguense TaxID=909936 RepID=A0ABP8EFM6_9MICO|nr:TRAP transporter substrate-binding protein DctP [Brevibacterium daeguense]